MGVYLLYQLSKQIPVLTSYKILDHFEQSWPAFTTMTLRQQTVQFYFDFNYGIVYC